jgi:branched-chain amino acid aminotransferase
MDPLIFHNRGILPLKEARLSPGQMGLFTGWGVFTTLRLYRGLPFAFDRHWARLARDASRLGIRVPCAQEAAWNQTRELALANHREEGMARILLVKNRGGLWSDAGDLPETDFLIFTRELTSWPASHRLQLVPQGIFSGGHYAGTKILSWVPHATVLEEAHAAGFDEALLLNERGELAECASANIFLVREGKVLTPPLASGCLPGITREILLEIAPRVGVKILEAELTTQDLPSVVEVFISSTTREVAPVDFVSPNWKFPAPGKTTLALEQAFKEYVHSWLARALEVHATH